MALLTRANRIANILTNSPKAILRSVLHPQPKKIWNTKGFEFWTFLSLLLQGSGCTRLLELGSGRSTVTFAEYATQKRARFVSLETSPEWFEKWKWELRYLRLNLPENPVRLIALDWSTGWYNLEQFHAAIGDRAMFDFVLIDAPNRLKKGNSKGMRDAKIAMQELRRCAGEADVIIIDDVHRRHVFDTIEQVMASPEQYESSFYDYVAQKGFSNSLFIGTKKSSAASQFLPRIRDLMGIRLYSSFHRDQCVED
jgi:predicted O-methyltransferase YrrM